VTTAAELRQKIDDALAEVTSAPRADKIVVTDVVRSAFIRLRSAREALASLRDAVEATD
jgi:hypothetical protein